MVFHESLNPERKFSLAIPLVFIAILGGTTSVVGVATVLSPQASFAVNPQAQLALAPAADAIQKTAAPVSKENGQCQAVYNLCTKLSRSDSNRASCESNWHSCVETKCKKIDTKTIDQCPADSDCTSSCTDLIEANGALKQCCSVIKHDNTCRTTIENSAEDSCNLERTKLPGGGSGTGGTPATPTNAEELEKLKQDAARYDSLAKAQRERADQLLGECVADGCSTYNREMGDKLQKVAALNESQRDAAYKAIKEYGIEPTPETPTPGDYQGENPGAIDAALKNSASYLGPTSPGLSREDLLNTPLSELNGRYTYGDTTITTDGKTYSVWSEGQRAAVVNDVRDGQTVADIVAQRQYVTGPESPFPRGQGTFAANVEAQGEVFYGNSGRPSPEQTDTSAFDKWSSELPGAMKKDPAFNFAEGGLDPSVAKAVGNANGDWPYSDSYNSSPKEIDKMLFAQLQKDPNSFIVPRGEVVQNPDNPREMFVNGSDRSSLLTYLGPSTDAATIRDEIIKDYYGAPSAPRPYVPGDPDYVVPRVRLATPTLAPDSSQPQVSADEGEQRIPLPQPKPEINAAPAPKASAQGGQGGEIPPAVNNRKPADNAGCDNADCFDKSPAKAPGGKVDANGNPVAPPGTKTGAGDTSKNGSGLGSGLGSALSSMLQGLMKALGAPQPTPPAPSQPCSTDPNIFAQQQQQYQQQLQQYNYQLQQQQYQQQQNQFYADRTGTPPPPVAPLPPQPSACTPSTGSQCREQPQQPATSSCTGGWRPVYSGSCITNWNCPTTGDAPTATLSCEPDLADVGQTLAITYNCSSGIASSSAFKITTQPGGSATTTIKASPRGTNTATYTLACTDNGKTTGAQCSVKVNRPNIFLVTNPRTVAPGGTALISWLTTGMDSCVISSPDQPDFTERNSSNTSVTGAATTSPITDSAMFQLDCITEAGMDKQATTSVSVAE